MLGRAAITVDYEPGKVVTVEQHDGSSIRLRKLNNDYDPTDRLAAQNFLQRYAAKGEVVTGLLYIEPNAGDLHASFDTVLTPLNQLNAPDLCPGQGALEKLNASMR